MSVATLDRRLGLGLLTLYGLGVMVGAGIYVLIGQAAGLSGVWAPAAFLAAGLIAGPTALVYGELAARIPEAGGEAAYVREAFGPIAPAGIASALPLIAAAMIAGGALISAAAVLQGGAGYLRAFVDAPVWLLASLCAAALTGVAVIGVLASAGLAAAFALAEIGGLLLVAWAGFAAEPSEAWRAATVELPPFPAAGFAGAALLAFFAFIGFEDVVNMAEETQDARRTVPRALLLALAITALLYALVSVAAVRAAAPEALAASERPLALVASRGAPWAGPALAGIAVLASLNGVLAQIMMAGRLIYGAARPLPWLAPLAAVHPRFRTPWAATLLAGAAALGLALALPLLSLAETSASILLLAFCAMNLALIVLRRRGPGPAGAFRAPGWAPWAGLVVSAAALAAPRLL